MNVTLSEFLEETNLWQQIVTDFNSTGVSYMNLNLQSKIKYGSRIVLPVFDDLEVTDLSSLIVELFSEKWNFVTSIAIKESDLVSDGSKIKTEVKTVDENNTSSNSTDNTVATMTGSQVSESGSGFNGSEIKDLDSNIEVNEYTFKFNDYYKNLSLVDKVNIMSVMVDDVVNYITLNIY